jgi:hypothetical protein
MSKTLLSKTGRKIRKDSFEANHDMDQIIEYLKYLYVDKQLSTNQIPLVMDKDYGIKITSTKCYNLIKDAGVIRDKSESVSLATSTLDYNVSFLDSHMIGIIEGILIGDGTIGCNHRTRVGRLSISGQYEEFIKYCYKLLYSYKPSEPQYIKSDGRKGGTGTWSISTKYHPDFYKIYQKWYIPHKDVPENINFTQLMVLLWYLGDGSISSSNESNSVNLYFSTNSFSKDKIKSILIPKFKEIDIQVSRITHDNRLFIKTNSIVKLLNYMGGKSPVQCYSYKFDIDDWRYKLTMKETAAKLNLDYQKLANWVKTGIVEYSRSPGGKKVLFSDKEFNELERRLNCGELSRIKGKKAIRQNSHLIDYSISKKHGEDKNQYIDRIADTFIQRGFPYKNYSFETKQKKWTRLRASQYLPLDSEIIRWSKHGLPLADSFHPHIYDLNRKGKISPYQLFHNKEMLKECLYNHKAYDGTMTSAKLLSNICSDVRSPRLNNFSPSLARDIYNYYCREGWNVIDPCAGFSGRLLGASVSKRNISYTGIDSSLRTYRGLIETKNFLSIVNSSFKVNIENGCSEDLLEQYRDNYFNMCFTSPPYFDTEEYDISNTQSYIRFTNYDQWIERFLKKIINELYRILMNGGLCIINIGKFGKYDISKDMSQIAQETGFTLLEQKYISFPVYGFVDSVQKERLEPMLIFKKP